jgi:hypothetical protein
MLRSRAITEVARMAASDALFGVINTPEELGAEVDEDGTVVHSVTQVSQPTGSGTERMRQIVGAPKTGGTEGSPAETSVAEGEAGSSPAGNTSVPPGITAAQVKKLATAMGKHGLGDRDSALAYVADVIGRTVASRNDLTKAEATKVIDHLEADIAAAESTPPTEPAEDVVDAEIVPESADAIWQRIVAVGQEQGMTVADVEDDFAERMEGLTSDSASAAELQHYLGLLTGEAAA